MSTTVTTPRIGARVLLLDTNDRVLLIHACGPHDRGHHWWELPGGGLDQGEQLEDAARREVAEDRARPFVAGTQAVDPRISLSLQGA
jgi:ADP-ribose pyrophosphatase YjhB (NUDIX family)